MVQVTYENFLVLFSVLVKARKRTNVSKVLEKCFKYSLFLCRRVFHGFCIITRIVEYHLFKCLKDVIKINIMKSEKAITGHVQVLGHTMYSVTHVFTNRNNPKYIFNYFILLYVYEAFFVQKEL
jgi:hypothetical protein